MSAVTAIAGTASAIGGMAICAATMGLGCGVMAAVGTSSAYFSFSIGSKLCELCDDPDNNEDNLLNFILPRVNKIITNQQKLEETITYEAMKTRLSTKNWMNWISDEFQETINQYAFIKSNTKLIMKEFNLYYV